MFNDRPITDAMRRALKEVQDVMKRHGLAGACVLVAPRRWSTYPTSCTRPGRGRSTPTRWVFASRRVLRKTGNRADTRSLKEPRTRFAPWRISDDPGLDGTDQGHAAA